MAYVINVPNHELPYGELITRIFEAFHVPLNYKKGEDPKRYDYFEETFLTMSQLKRENGVWWLRIGENRRRDNEEVAPAENEEVHEEEQNLEFDWEAEIDEAAFQGNQGQEISSMMLKMRFKNLRRRSTAQVVIETDSISTAHNVHTPTHESVHESTHHGSVADMNDQDQKEESTQHEGHASND
ncbi:hypothetical protein Dimus_020915 [Dionaea muscipula]